MRPTIYTAASLLAATTTLARAATIDVLERTTTTGTAGCGTSHIFNGITQYHSLQSGGVDRSYSIHLPSDYNETAPYPLIGFFFEADTGLSDSQYSADIWIRSDLLDAVRAGWCIDNTRIYATGMSIGGGFVNTIACSPFWIVYTDASGLNDGCTPPEPLPILEIHGGADPDVHYAGGPGEGGIEPAIPDWLSWWAERNGCGTNTSETLFNGDRVEGLLQHWKVDDMGHCWASTSLDFSEIAAGQGPTPIDASTIIMAFFDLFTKP
ncbi:hypothetical protein B0H12DRAFT_1145488 [Mycena haematopus]|nr:hypothetical protein B0H12DRAFT_1145488 [Mycena haematopus]